MISSNEMFGRIFSQNCIWHRWDRWLPYFFYHQSYLQHLTMFANTRSSNLYPNIIIEKIIFLHRFTIFKKIITSSLFLDLTIFNIPRYQYLQQFLGRSRKKTKKKQKIEESTTSYEILNKISNKKILIPKQSKRIHVKERKSRIRIDKTIQRNWSNLVEK